MNYLPLECVLDQPCDLSEFTHLEIKLKASQRIKVSMRLNDATGSHLASGWSQKDVTGLPQKFTFLRTEMDPRKDADLTSISSVTIGLGLWPCDTTKQTVEIEIQTAKIVDPAECFLIPRPTAGVVIDGAYKKDWGQENVLYLWTPPCFIRLAGSKAAVKKPIPRPDELSGSFSFMHDLKNLYFLAVIADQTPSSGNDRVAPWNNDSVELFLASGIRARDLRSKRSLKKNGIQLIFDLSAHGKPSIMKKGQVVSADDIQYKYLKSKVMVNGSPVSGGVLEAAIPLALLSNRLKRGDLIAYCINLNDSTRGFQLRSNTQCHQPAATIHNYSKAYLDYQGTEKLPQFKFGPLASDPPWPPIYHAKGKRIWQDTQPYRELETTREKVFLNGLWAVQGTKDEGTSPDPNKWFYAPLPMTIGWHTPIFKRAENKQNTLVSGNYRDITDKGKNHFFWYERTCHIPAEWKGKIIRLRFDHLEKEALVYMNGTFAGLTSMLSPHVDMSAKLLYGQTNRIDIRLMGQMPPGPSLNNTGGIIGDLYLEIFQNQPRIKDVWIRKADGLNGNFLIQLSAPDLTSGNVTWEILSPDDVSLCHGSQATNHGKTIVISGNCQRFVPWSLSKPQLCTLLIKAIRPDGTLSEERRVPFGFRTFTVANGHFMLNGNIIRLRTALPRTMSKIYDPGRMDYLKKLGHNAIYLHSINSGYNDPLYDLCDQKGFLILAPIEQTYSEEQTLEAIRRIRNHPSIIGYLGDRYGQLIMNGFNFNPFENDDTTMPASREARDMEAFMNKREALFKKADPQRNYVAQGTGNWKDFIRILHYYPTNGLNLMDRTMYHYPWSKRKNKKLPLYLIEAGTVNLFEMDSKHPEHRFPVMENRFLAPRQLLREIASRYLGNQAFHNWMPWSKMLFQAGLRDFRLNGVDGFCAWTDELNAYPLNTERAEGIIDRRRLSYRYFLEPVKGNEDHQWMRINSWYYRLRALAYYQWPEEYGQEKLTKKETLFAGLYKNELQPMYVTITGEKNSIFTRDHNFYGGETLHKQIAMVNDSEQDALVQGKIELIVRGKENKVIPFHKNVKQGIIERMPVEFKLPTVTEKTAGRITLTAAGRQETFHITLFPKPNRQKLQNLARKVKIGICQTGRQSIARRAGLTGQSVDLKAKIPNEITVLIVERGALTRDANRQDLANFLRKGGQMLIFEQDDTSLYSHHAHEQRLEHAFITDCAHPAVAGLDSQDLSFWRGRAETVVSEKRPHEAFRHDMSVALETPHLTNLNLVAGFALENPSYGDIHPIVTGGYDGNYSVVLEARSGLGRILFCQADVTSRYDVDPAATRLADNLLEAILQPVTPRLPGVRYTGNDAGRQLLTRLGIAILKDSPVCVVGPGNYDPQIIDESQTIVRLPDANFLPKGVSLRKQYLRYHGCPHFWNGGIHQFQLLTGSMPGTDFPDTAGKAFSGLSAADCYLFENPQTEAYEFQMKDQDTRSTYGSFAQLHRKGKTMVLCAMAPNQVNYGEEKRKIFRIWSVIFANLNIRNSEEITWQTSPWDVTDSEWNFITDPSGDGEKIGFQRGNFGSHPTHPIKTGLIWEAQGITEENPHLESAPGSAYDGYGWYVTELNLTSVPQGTIYFHVNGIRDIATFRRTEHHSTLFINGKKMPEAIGIYNAYLGGRGARLWKLDANKVLHHGKNRIAICIYNNRGAGGIHKNPVRFELPGKNQDLLFPYEFNECKYTNDFFWCW